VIFGDTILIYSYQSMGLPQRFSSEKISIVSLNFTGLKSFKGLAAGHRYGGLILAVSSLIAQLLATGLFLYTIARIAIGAGGARRPLSPELALALQALGAFLLVVASFALIHSEARHLMPVVPAFLIATAVAVARPAMWRQRHNVSN
jgi:hypothetical protein